MSKLCFLVLCLFALALAKSRRERQLDGFCETYCYSDTSGGGGVVGAGVCQSPAFGGEGDWGSSDFELRAPTGQRIEAIHLCATGDSKFSGFVGGFQVLYTNGFLSETIGCKDRQDIYDPIILSEDEDVTAVEIYHGTNNYWDAHVVQALSIRTTERVYGPYGTAGQVQKEILVGNNLIGFNGTAGYILDNLSVIWESC